MFYADSSFLVALYLSFDTHSERARSWTVRHAEPIAFTPFQRLELRNAIRIHEWRGDIGPDDMREALI